MSVTTGGEEQAFNSRFLNWASAAVVNPKNGFRFCNHWFITSVNRGRAMDVVLEPLDQEADSGVKILLRDPPEQVRLWHPLPDGLLEAGKKVVRMRVRGLPDGGEPLQLDSVALFSGDDNERKVDRRLVGSISLNSNWHEFAVPLRTGGTPVDGRRYLSLRFSGKGVVEIDFCRIDSGIVSAGALSSAKSLAAKVLAGFRRTTPTAPGDDGSLDDEQVVTDSPLVVGSTGPEEITSVKLSLESLPEPPAAGGKPNVLHNARFQTWANNRPELWSVSLPKGAAVKRTLPSRDHPCKTAYLTLIFDKTAPDQCVSIGQRVVGLGARQIVDIVLVGQADTRTDVDVLLTAASGKVVEGAKVTITLWPRWQFRAARMVLPGKLPDGALGFALMVRSGQGHTVNLAFAGAGAPDQDIASEFEYRQLPSVDSNAVVNSKFDHWSGPLARSLSLRRLKVTDEWLLVNKSPSPGVEARLTEISPRGLRDGSDHPNILGLALHGEIGGPYLRVEATLDGLQIAVGAPRQLRFYARTAATSPPVDSSRDRSVVHQVFVAERRRLSPEGNEFDVKRLFTIRRNIRIGRIGELHALDLRPDHRALLAAKAKEILHDTGRSLLLIFEFTGFVDIAIGGAYLGNNAASAEATLAATNGVAIEDPNIATQLTLLKGLEHWQTRQALSAAPYRPQAVSPVQASWTWLPESKFTVDIVICVYNAVEETLGCLDSIFQHTTIPHTVTIIDDKSNDLTREQLRRYVQGKPWIRLIENETNRGYTRSANIGLSSSTAEWVVLLNSDTIVTPGWLEGMFEVVKARPNVAMVGPLSNAASWQSVPDLHDVKGGWSVNPLPEGYSPADIAGLVAEFSPKQFPEATLLNGFCTLMRRDVVEEVGYLDEVAFPMGYGEENDLCLRVRKAGYLLALADHVYVYHVKSASFGSARRSELSKRGTAQLLAKHPDVDMKAVQRDMAELTSLMELRKKLRRKLRVQPVEPPIDPGPPSGPSGRPAVAQAASAQAPSGLVSYQVH